MVDSIISFPRLSASVFCGTSDITTDRVMLSYHLLMYSLDRILHNKRSMCRGLLDTECRKNIQIVFQVETLFEEYEEVTTNIKQNEERLMDITGIIRSHCDGIKTIFCTILSNPNPFQRKYEDMKRCYDQLTMLDFKDVTIKAQIETLQDVIESLSCY